MGNAHERGEGRLGTIVTLAVLVAAGWATWNVAPVYIDHYDFVDKVNEICRTPRYLAPSNDAVLDLLMKQVRERRLEPWIAKENFDVSTVATSRQIRVRYEREVEVLPGFKHAFKFDFLADQPLI